MYNIDRFLQVLDFVLERHPSATEQYCSKLILHALSQMHGEDYTAALDLYAETVGKQPTWAMYCLSHGEIW